MVPTTRLSLRSSVYVQMLKGVGFLKMVLFQNPKGKTDFGVKYFTYRKVVNIET